MAIVFKNLAIEAAHFLKEPSHLTPKALSSELRDWGRRTRKLAARLPVAAPTRAAMLAAADQADVVTGWPERYFTIGPGAKMTFRDLAAGALLWAIQELQTVTKDAARDYTDIPAPDYEHPWPDLFHGLFEPRSSLRSQRRPVGAGAPPARSARAHDDRARRGRCAARRYPSASPHDGRAPAGRLKTIPDHAIDTTIRHRVTQSNA